MTALRRWWHDHPGSRTLLIITAAVGVWVALAVPVVLALYRSTR